MVKYQLYKITYITDRQLTVSHIGQKYNIIHKYPLLLNQQTDYLMSDSQ